jgi:AcrR family transcriptional regulator
VERNRRRRTEAYLRAGIRIVAEEGFDALTMARLSEELDIAVGAVYHYFPSKGHLLTAIQASAIERLAASYDRCIDPMVDAVVERTGEDPGLIRLVVIGRWFCAAAEVLPDEVRLLQMVNARRGPTLEEGGGDVLLPASLALLRRVAGVVEEAQASGSLRPASPMARTVVWAAALGGVLAAEDLGQYLPGIAGEGQLGPQVNVDLCVGWGADADTVERIDRAVDEAARSIPLA